MRPVFLIAVAALMVVSSTAYANMVSNGSFELGTYPGSTYIAVFPGGTDITGWGVTGGGVDYIGVAWQASDGIRSIDLNDWTPGGIYQAIVTVPGAQYAVVFDLAGNPSLESYGNPNPKVKLLGVTAGGSSQEYSFDVTGHDIQHMGWEERTFLFTASSSTTILSFTSLNDGPCGPALDNVRVNTVPEPSGLLALLCGVSTLGVLWRRKR